MRCSRFRFRGVGGQKHATMSASPKVLIVEDEYLTALDLMELIEGWGLVCVGPAASGEEAVRLADRTRPDLAIVDISLRGRMDGIDTATKLRETCPVRIIFLSSYQDMPTRERAARLQPLDFMLKPYDEYRLRELLRQAITDR